MSEEKEEIIEEKAKEMAKKASEMHKTIAEQHASAFEAWLREHQDATVEEAHKRLTSTIEAAIMFGMMSLMMI